MKKLLLSLSVLCAMGLSLQATADVKRDAVKNGVRALQQGQRAAGASRGIVGQGMGSTVLNDSVRVVLGQGAAISTADEMFSANAASSGAALEGPTCSLNNVGGVDTTAAVAAGLVQPSVCMTEISHVAKAKWAQAMVRVANYIQGLGGNLKFNNLSNSQKQGAQQAWWSGLASSIGISYNQARDRARQMCSSCADLNPFCAI